VRKGDLKSQGKPDELGLTVERGTSMGTAMQEEADHHKQMIKRMKIDVSYPSKGQGLLGGF